MLPGIPEANSKPARLSASAFLAIFDKRAAAMHFRRTSSPSSIISTSSKPFPRVTTVPSYTPSKNNVLLPFPRKRYSSFDSAISFISCSSSETLSQITSLLARPPHLKLVYFDIGALSIIFINGFPPYQFCIY